MSKGTIAKIGTLIGGTVIIGGVLALSSCARVDVAHEGVKVNKLGGNKGVQAEALTTGRYWLTWNEVLYQYPVFTQTKIWTDDNREKSPLSEEFNITTRDGGTFSVDIGVNYHVAKGSAPIVFEKWRVGINQVTDVHIRRLIQDQFTKVGSTYTAFDVMANRTQIVESVETATRESLAKFGIVVEQVFMIGIKAPPSIMRAMESKMQAVELTAQRQQEVEQAKAEAEKLVAAANGKAQAINVEGEALRKNPTVLVARAIEKWNGRAPMVVGGGGTMMDMKGMLDSMSEGLINGTQGE